MAKRGPKQSDQASNTCAALEARYADLLKGKVAVLPKVPTTFFDIAGFPHYENVISNFYAYYLDPHADHGFGDLFLNALTSLIQAGRQSERTIEDTLACEVEREVFTANGKFIDLVVREYNADGKRVKNAIIIENKIYAAVYNDLDEYYKHIQAKNKVGVLLSLRKPAKPFHTDFICITHNELMQQVDTLAGEYLPEAEHKQVHILNDFIQNMKNLGSKQASKDEYEFYFRHAEKIREMHDLYTSVTQDLFRSVEKLPELLGMELAIAGRSSPDLRFLKSRVAPVHFTVWMQNYFLGQGSIYVIVEFHKPGIARLDETKSISFSKTEQKLLNKTPLKRPDYLHFSEIEVTPTETDILDLGNFLKHEIEESGLKSIFEKIEQKLMKG
jgi:hypothetical protein